MRQLDLFLSALLDIVVTIHANDVSLKARGLKIVQSSLMQPIMKIFGTVQILNVVERVIYLITKKISAP